MGTKSENAGSPVKGLSRAKTPSRQGFGVFGVRSRSTRFAQSVDAVFSRELVDVEKETWSASEQRELSVPDEQGAKTPTALLAAWRAWREKNNQMGEAAVSGGLGCRRGSSATRPPKIVGVVRVDADLSGIRRCGERRPACSRRPANERGCDINPAPANNQSKLDVPPSSSSTGFTSSICADCLPINAAPAVAGTLFPLDLTRLRNRSDLESAEVDGLRPQLIYTNLFVLSTLGVLGARKQSRENNQMGDATPLGMFGLARGVKPNDQGGTAGAVPIATHGALL